jgi:hypothetical protein
MHHRQRYLLLLDAVCSFTCCNFADWLVFVSVCADRHSITHLSISDRLREKTMMSQARRPEPAVRCLAKCDAWPWNSFLFVLPVSLQFPFILFLGRAAHRGSMKHEARSNFFFNSGLCFVRKTRMLTIGDACSMGHETCLMVIQPDLVFFYLHWDIAEKSRVARWMYSAFGIALPCQRI